MKKITYKQLKQELEKHYKVRGSINSILNGSRKPNSDFRYMMLEKYGIPFNGWGDKLLDNLMRCECCNQLIMD